MYHHHHNAGRHAYGVPHEYRMLRDLAIAFNVKSIPPATACLVVLCCGVHLARIILQLDVSELAFVPHRVLCRLEIYRIFTGALVHLDNFHLLSNMLCILSFHAPLERRFGTLRLLESCIWATILSKGIYLLIALDRLLFHEGAYLWHTPVAGFSGVIFFMAVLDCCLFPYHVREVEFPFIGIIRVPSPWYPWLLLVSCEIWHPWSSLTGHLSGVIAGALVASGMLDPYFASRETLQSLERSEMLAFLVKKRLFVTAPPTRSRPIDEDILWRIYRGFKQVLLPLLGLVVSLLCSLICLLLGMGANETFQVWQGVGHQLDGGDAEQESLATSLGLSSTGGDRAESEVTTNQESLGAGEIGLEPVENMESLLDTSVLKVEKGALKPASCVPEAFSSALSTLTSTNDDPETTAKALKRVFVLVSNAAHKGQQDPRYWKVRVANPLVQDGNIPGAHDLLEAAGFEIKEDFEDEKFLVYSHKSSPPKWTPHALEMIQDAMDTVQNEATVADFGADKDDYRRRAGAAALQRQRAAKKKKAKKAASKKHARGYSAGMSAGSNQTVFYRGGT